MPLRILLVEDNEVYRSSLEAVLELQDGLEVVGGIGEGGAAAESCRALAADVVLMDVRLPGLDGVAATAAVRAACPGAAVVCLTAEATASERDAALAAGAAELVRERPPGPGACRGDPACETECTGVTLTAENTAIVLDSTSDFPEAQERFPNMRVVPLYVIFGDERFRDEVDLTPDAFYAKLADATALPTTSQPTPQDFLDAYEELAGLGFERIWSLHLTSKLSGTFQSASLAAQELGGERVRLVDSETASLAVAMLALAIQRRLARGRRTRRSRL